MVALYGVRDGEVDREIGDGVRDHRQHDEDCRGAEHVDLERGRLGSAGPVAWR